MLLRHENVVTLRDHVTQAQITTGKRGCAGMSRSAQGPTCHQHVTGWIVDRVLQKANADLGQRLQPVINAVAGVVLHQSVVADAGTASRRRERVTLHQYRT